MLLKHMVIRAVNLLVKKLVTGTAFQCELTL